MTLVPVDLARARELVQTELQPTLLRRPDGLGIFYPRRVNSLSGEAGSGKTWLAMVAAAEQLGDGGRLLYLDWEDNAIPFLDRLSALGISEEIAFDQDQVIYVKPREPLVDLDVAYLERIVTEVDTETLIIVDSLSRALAGNGAAENSNDDVTTFVDWLFRPLVDAGATVLLIDHTGKPTERGGTRGARGASAKQALVGGSAIELRADKAFSRSFPGRLSLRVVKDRHGWIGGAGNVAAYVNVGVGPVFALEVPTATSVAMTLPLDEVSAFVASENEAGRYPSAREIEARVSGNASATRAARKKLVDAGVIEVVLGPRRRQSHRIASSASQPRPECVPDTVGVTASTASTPLGVADGDALDLSDEMDALIGPTDSREGGDEQPLTIGVGA